MKYSEGFSFCPCGNRARVTGTHVPREAEERGWGPPPHHIRVSVDLRPSPALACVIRLSCIDGSNTF